MRALLGHEANRPGSHKRLRSRTHCGGGIGLTLLAAVLFVGCKGEPTEKTAETQPGEVTAGPAASAAEFSLPELDLGELPFALQTKIGAARREARRSPDDAPKLADLAALCYVHGFPEVALTCFERAAQVDPDRTLWWYYVGLTQEKLGRPAQAVAAYDKALARSENQPDNQSLIRVKLGAVLIGQDRARAAELFR